uniref:Uncharacterized protein n=1 Tax=Gopherus agassizii TaxID=38772 RepID=A0A452J3T5_9SAUR
MHLAEMRGLPQALAMLLRVVQAQLSALWLCLAPFSCRLRGALLPGRSPPLLEEGAGEPGGAEVPTVPISVNYHFTRQCNYRCGFCFHTAKTSFVLPLEEAKRGLAMLKEAGEYLDILAVSCDSFDEEVNVLIGLGQGNKNHIENLQRLRKWCEDYAVAFKLNSVINRFNVDEDMNEQVKALNPVRWKVFQCLYSLIILYYQKLENSMIMRFLNCRNGRKEPSKSILDVGVEHAIKFSGFDEKMFLNRGGKYVWSKADMKLEW